MTLSRKPRRIYDQRLTAAYRPIWSPGLFEVNFKSLYQAALETAVLQTYCKLQPITGHWQTNLFTQPPLFTERETEV